MLYHVAAETKMLRDFIVFADSASEARAKTAAFLYTEEERKPMHRDSIHPEIEETHQVHILGSSLIGFDENIPAFNPVDDDDDDWDDEDDFDDEFDEDDEEEEYEPLFEFFSD